jgi:hypothetical protein
MQFLFTKGPRKHDRMQVVRDDASVESIDCPKQGIIPHDMVHFAVESTLRRRGFLARVRDGEAATFRMLPEQESDAVERLVEVFQADGWSGWRGDAADLIELYHVTCRARACAPLPLSPSDLEAVRHRLLELTARWETLPVGQSLALAFD